MHQIGKNVRFTQSGPKLGNFTSIISVKLGVIFGEGYFYIELHFPSHFDFGKSKYDN